MHKTDFAPVLSATSNRDSVWIISIVPNLYRRGAHASPADQSWSRQQHLRTTRKHSRLGMNSSRLFKREPWIMPRFKSRSQAAPDNDLRTLSPASGRHTPNFKNEYIKFNFASIPW